MKTAFLETNAFWRFLDEGISGKEVRAILSCHGLEPAIGLHVIYELSLTYLKDKCPEKSKNLFSIVRDLNPLISEPPEVLLKYEFQKYRDGSRFDPFMTSTRKQESRNEIIKLSNGVFDEKALSFISKRDRDFKADHKTLGQKNIEIFQMEPPKMRLKTFEDVAEYYKKGIPQLVEQILFGIADSQQSYNISMRLDNFPVLRSTVMSNLYTIFIAIYHKQIPSTDKIDDHRHLIEASYCNVFITEEKQLLRNVNRINPLLTAKKWSEIGRCANF